MIPSGFYTAKDNLRAGDVAVVAYGVPRSGSTFIWQLLNDLFPDGGVVKTHDWLDVAADVPVVATIRDWRDCIVSHWRMGKPEDAQMSGQEVLDWVATCRRWVCIWEYYHNLRHLQVIQYDMLVFYAMDHAVWPKIEAAIGTSVAPEQRRQLERAHSLERNREVAATVAEGFDPDTLIHRDHVHEGGTGAWSRFMSDGNARLMTALLGRELIMWGHFV